MSNSSLSVIIPLFNEFDGIPQLKEKLIPVLDRLASKHSIELILIDDGSTDGTYARLQEFFGKTPRARLIRHEKNLNLGAAIRTGSEAATSDWLVFLDSDCTYAPEIIDKLAEELRTGADLATASPYHPLGKVVGVPGYRLWLSKGLSMIYRFLLKKQIYTYTAMVRAFRKSVYPILRSEKNDFSSVAEMMLKALSANLIVREVPAVLEIRRYGSSKMRLVRVILAHIFLIQKIIFQPEYFFYETGVDRTRH